MYTGMDKVAAALRFRPHAARHTTTVRYPLGNPARLVFPVIQKNLARVLLLLIIMQWFYNLAIRSYLLAISIAALFSPKARMWIRGRKGVFAQFSKMKHSGDRLIWFHCASAGEFEQGRPVIEAFRQAYPKYRILLTFFSPSGYELRKNYPNADHVSYLPADTPANARKFVTLVQPALAVFVKYEFWANYIKVLHKANIPLLVLSAIFRSNQVFFKWYGQWYLTQLKLVTRFMVQDINSAELLAKAGIMQVTVTGDTRFDRVASIEKQEVRLPVIERFVADQPVLVAGSTWPTDEHLLAGLQVIGEGKIKLIVVPHEIDRNHLSRLSGLFARNIIRYSEIGETDEALLQSNILIVDTYGLLSVLYRYASVAYVGGGFGKGIHNVAEAAVYGVPVLFGPRYHKFREAVELISLGGAFTVNDVTSLNTRLNYLLADDHARHLAGEIAHSYVYSRSGATARCMDVINTVMGSNSFIRPLQAQPRDRDLP